MASVRSLNCLLLLFGVCALLTSFASGDTVTVGIVLVQHVSYGQSFKLVGNTAELGNWDTSKGITMTYTQGDVWTASVELNRGESYEYKAVVVDSSSDTCACWMPGGNRVLKIPSDAKSVYFVSTFWDTNTCASTCSTTNACSFDNVGSCSSINIRKKNHKADSVTVAFVMTQHLSFGQGFRLVGNTADLGNWQPSNGLQMTWHTGDVWTASTEMNTGESLQYKAVVVDSNTGETCYCWMPDPNRSLTIPSDAPSVYFVSVLWDQNSCASSCSNTNACSVGNVGTCSSMTSRLNAWMKYKTISSIV